MASAAPGTGDPVYPAVRLVTTQRPFLPTVSADRPGSPCNRPTGFRDQFVRRVEQQHGLNGIVTSPPPTGHPTPLTPAARRDSLPRRLRLLTLRDPGR